MEIKLILPNVYVPIGANNDVFFLAGPILGGDDWQSKAIRLLAKRLPEADIVCPSRYSTDHPLYRYALKGDSDVFKSQTLWERHYLLRASTSGSIIFWLPKESRVNPRPPETGPYARDTYGELGEWRMRAHYDKARVVIGAHPDFPGLSVIEKNYRAAVRNDFVIHATLKETVEAAIELAHPRY